MTDIDDAIDDVRDAAVDLLNSEGRSAAHVADLLRIVRISPPLHHLGEGPRGGRETKPDA